MCVTFSRLVLDTIVFISVGLVGIMLYGHLSGSGGSFICSASECKLTVSNPFGGSISPHCFSVYLREVCIHVDLLIEISLRHHQKPNKFWIF